MRENLDFYLDYNENCLYCCSFLTFLHILHDMSIGKNLKKLRKRAGLSYRRLGAKVGISHNNLAVYEKDKFGPSLENAVKIARFFKVPVEYLLYGEKAEFRYRDIELVELFGRVDELPEEYRQMIKDYMKQVIVHSDENENLKKRSNMFPQKTRKKTDMKLHKSVST